MENLFQTACVAINLRAVGIFLSRKFDPTFIINKEFNGKEEVDPTVLDVLLNFINDKGYFRELYGRFLETFASNLFYALYEKYKLPHRALLIGCKHNDPNIVERAIEDGATNLIPGLILACPDNFVVIKMILGKSSDLYRCIQILIANRCDISRYESELKNAGAEAILNALDLECSMGRRILEKNIKFLMSVKKGSLNEKLGIACKFSNRYGIIQARHCGATFCVNCRINIKAHPCG
jgi:hypothetical protein